MRSSATCLRSVPLKVATLVLSVLHASCCPVAIAPELENLAGAIQLFEDADDDVSRDQLSSVCSATGDIGRWRSCARTLTDLVASATDQPRRQRGCATGRDPVFDDVCGDDACGFCDDALASTVVTYCGTPGPTGAPSTSTEMPTATPTILCRSDLCGDYGNDCCAPGSEPRSCTASGYVVQSGGSSSYAPCLSTYGQTAIYQCCLEEHVTAAPTIDPATCRSDICNDKSGDCCAPGSEARGCRLAGYTVQSGGTSSYKQCRSRFGEEAIYQCCATPTESPSSGPTSAPTSFPSDAPTGSPTAYPTSLPTLLPTDLPSTAYPSTSFPTSRPTRSPTARATKSPTSLTTGSPTLAPTSDPTSAPSVGGDRPTGSPTPRPSVTASTPTARPSSSPVNVAPSSSAPSPPRCSNSVRDGDETDIDCGGTRCVACGVGLACRADADCAAGLACTAQKECTVALSGGTSHAPTGSDVTPTPSTGTASSEMEGRAPDDSASVPMMAGIGIGAAFLVCAGGFGVLLLRRRKRRWAGGRSRAKRASSQRLRDHESELVELGNVPLAVGSANAQPDIPALPKFEGEDQVPASMDGLLASRYHRARFMKFSEELLAAESLLFWEAVERYEKIGDVKPGRVSVARQRLGTHIVDEYIRTGANNEINVSSSERNALQSLGSEANPFTKTSFRRAKDEIFDLMRRNFFDKYVEDCRRAEKGRGLGVS